MALSRLILGNPAGCALAALVVLLAGYADLWRGGTSLAAVLLVLGYLLLVPLTLRAFLGDRRDGGALDAATPVDDPPPYRTAAILAALVLALYVLTLAPTTAMWDASEYIAVAKILGLPHPPGNPLFVLVAHVFGLIPIPVSYAERVNLLAATTSAISAAFWFLVTHRVLRGSGLSPVPRQVVAAAGAWIGATAFTVWNQSVVNEKVYTLALLGVAVVAWLTLRWNDAPAESRRADYAMLLVAYLCGLGYTIHPAGFLPLPAVGLFVLLRRPKTVLRYRFVGTAVAMLALGLTPFLFEPIRASHNPPINEGHPSACEGAPQMDCLFSGTTWTRLKANIQREQYGGHNVAQRQAPLTAQFGMWWMYFEWQWWRDALREHPGVQRALAVTMLMLALLGAVAHWRQDRETFLFVGPLLLTLTPLLVFYLNFKYGWSQSPELGDGVPREVRDRDYFYVWSFASLAVWIGVGLGAVWQFLASRLGGATGTAQGAAVRGSTPAHVYPTARAWAITAPVLLLALVPLVGNRTHASRAGETFTREWARDLLGSVEPYAVLITNGDNDSFPLWYAQQVEGVRRDVSVVLTPYLGLDWYVRQQLRVKVDPYQGGGLPAFGNATPVAPDVPLLKLTDAEADAIPPYMQLSAPHEFSHGRIQATVPAGIIGREQIVTLRLIADAFPARPVYFSVGRFPHSIGLGEHVVTQGLVQRLTDLPARELPGVLRYPGGYIDVARSKALWDRYTAPQALLDGPRWNDEASLMIPSVYVATGELLGYALAASGDAAASQQVMERTGAVATKLGMTPRQ